MFQRPLLPNILFLQTWRDYWGEVPEIFHQKRQIYRLRSAPA